ncbi:MAG: Holliday junction branch migration protein RuvA [Bacteroidota bacterium]|jgi:Holliday junction DNA helicase RuvA
MISHLQGLITEKSSTEIVVECSGVGYSAMISVNTSGLLPAVGEKTKVLTLLIHREDAMQLFGFATEQEREAFKILISISGIGPKSALGILSSISVEELQKYVISNNTHALQKLPGVGKKTAERLALELRDKIMKIETVDSGLYDANQSMILQEALSALMTLGYSRLTAEKAVKSAFTELKNEQPSAEKLIRQSLKFAII